MTKSKSARRAESAIAKKLRKATGRSEAISTQQANSKQADTHRMLLPAGRLHNGGNCRSLRLPQHVDDVGLLGIGLLRRDRFTTPGGFTWFLSDRRFRLAGRLAPGPVSYTHLTLPTILLV